MVEGNDWRSCCNNEHILIINQYFMRQFWDARLADKDCSTSIGAYVVGNERGFDPDHFVRV